MFRKSLLSFFLSSALGVLLAIGAANAAEVVVRVGPPAPIVETRVPSPGAGYVWTPGYHRWDGNRYVWTAGAWIQPPRLHARWVAHHWVRRNGGWVMVEGHWR